jgi:hypothetical protein
MVVSVLDQKRASYGIQGTWYARVVFGTSHNVCVRVLGPLLRIVCANRMTQRANETLAAEGVDALVNIDTIRYLRIEAPVQVLLFYDEEERRHHHYETQCGSEPSCCNRFPCHRLVRGDDDDDDDDDGVCLFHQGGIWC